MPWSRLWRWGLVATIAAALAVGAGWLLGREADRSLRADLLEQASIVAALLPAHALGTLTGTEADLDRTEYRELKTLLVQVREASPKYRFVYLIGSNVDGRVVFFVDSEPPDSPDYSPPGQGYESPATTSWKPLVVGPLTDNWGTWVSAFLPLTAADSEPMVALGMDIDARAWIWAIVGRAALPAAALAVAAVLVLLVARAARANRAMRKRETQLRESYRTAEDLIRTIPAGLYLYQFGPPDSLKLISGNPEAERLSGVHAEDWVGREHDEIWPESKQAGITKTYLDVMRTSRPFVGDDVWQSDSRLNGCYRVRAFPLPGNRLAVAFEDVTERARAEARVRDLLEESNEARAALLSILEDEKQAEESLRRSEAKFAAAFRTSPYALTVTRARDGQFLDVNDAFTTISGYTREEAMANSSIGLRLWADAADRLQVLASLGKGESVTGREFLFRHRDGHTIAGRFSAQRIVLHDEPCVLSSIDDVTESKRAEESVRESEERFASAFRTSPYAITISRVRDGRFLEVNDAFTSIAGYAREDAVGKTSADLRIWVDEDDRRRVVAELEGGKVVRGKEFLFRRKNGTALTGLFSAQVIVLNGEPCIVASIDDITQRKRAEAERQRLQEQLVQSQKMEYVGRLAGGIAHDFNNLLMGIMSYVELCRDRIDEEPVRGWLDEITRDAKRSADLTRQLLAFARRQTIAPVVLDLNVALPGTLRMIQRLVGEDIEIVWRPGSGPMPVKIDPSQLDQVLVNLAVNARDAIGGAGRLALETARTDVDERRAAAVQSPPGSYVELVITDNGAGMTRETLEHVFEPFYTTKTNGEGTGLGLATVYGIVRQNGGFIEVVSTPGQGTTFRVCLPAEADEAPQVKGGSEMPSCPRGDETVLVVEDEKSIRVTLEQFLADLGYVVLAAAAAEAALGLAGRHEGTIDLLITDVVMPGMSGRVLAERLRQRRPGLRCLFISGYTADVIATRGVLDASVDFLAKPFTRDELARKVREILDR